MKKNIVGIVGIVVIVDVIVVVVVVVVVVIIISKRGKEVGNVGEVGDRGVFICREIDWLASCQGKRHHQNNQPQTPPTSPPHLFSFSLPRLFFFPLKKKNVVAAVHIKTPPFKENIFE